MSDTRDLLRRTAEHAADYLDTLGERPVFPEVTPEQLRAALGGPLPEDPLPADQVVEELVAGAEPGVVAMGSGRYFGFVIGGGLPAALAADWLTSAWDQNAGLYVAGPSASVVEQITRDWLLELLGLPGESSIGFVTGTQVAHVTGLAAARWHVLDAVGWDVGRDGLTGAPRIRVLVGEQRHVTIDRALRLLGLGAPTTVAADDQGRMLAGRPGRGTGRRRGRADDRLRAGGRSEHRRVRPAAGDRAALARRAGHGCTSTAPSGSGPPSRRACATSSTGSSSPTRGRPTRTSG